MKMCEYRGQKELEQWSNGNLEFGEEFEDMELYLELISSKIKKSNKLFVLVQNDIDHESDADMVSFLKKKLNYAKSDLQKIKNKLNGVREQINGIIC